jgi:hypothetical protein
MGKKVGTTNLLGHIYVQEILGLYLIDIFLFDGYFSHKIDNFGFNGHILQRDRDRLVVNMKDETTFNGRTLTDDVLEWHDDDWLIFFKYS